MPFKMVGNGIPLGASALVIWSYWGKYIPSIIDVALLFQDWRSRLGVEVHHCYRWLQLKFLRSKNERGGWSSAATHCRLLTASVHIWSFLVRYKQSNALWLGILSKLVWGAWNKIPWTCYFMTDGEDTFLFLDLIPSTLFECFILEG